MSLREEHYDMITEMDSPVANTVERFYRQNPSKYTREKIRDMGPGPGKKHIFKKWQQDHIIRHLERSGVIQAELTNRAIEQAFPTPLGMEAPKPPPTAGKYKLIHIKGYRVPRKRYYVPERALTPVGWRNVERIKYRKAYTVKGYSYAVEIE